MLDFYDSNSKHLKKVIILIASKDKRFFKQTYPGNIDEVVFIILPHKKLAADRRKEIKSLDKILNHYSQIKWILCTDNSYYKILAKKLKTGYEYGYVYPYLDKNLVLGVSPTTMQFKPSMIEFHNLSLKALDLPPFTESVFENKLPYLLLYDDAKAVKQYLINIFDTSTITLDIETESLFLPDAYLVSTAIATKEGEGISFLITDKTKNLLKRFLINYKGTIIYHGGAYDIKCIIYHLFMDNPNDMNNMIDALDILCENIHDTKLLAYLQTNSASGNNLSLKHLAFTKYGNYGIDAGDLSNYSTEEILTYNLTDCYATWFVFNKYQEEINSPIYKNLLLPSVKSVVEREIVGLPNKRSKVVTLSDKLNNRISKLKTRIKESQIIKDYTEVHREHLAEKANLKLKKLRKTSDDFENEEFNPESNIQLSDLLFNFIGLPSLSKTKGGNSSTDKDTIKSLLELLKRN